MSKNFGIVPEADGGNAKLWGASTWAKIRAKRSRQRVSVPATEGSANSVLLAAFLPRSWSSACMHNSKYQNFIAKHFVKNTKWKVPDEYAAKIPVHFLVNLRVFCDVNQC